MLPQPRSRSLYSCEHENYTQESEKKQGQEALWRIKTKWSHKPSTMQLIHQYWPHFEKR